METEMKLQVKKEWKTPELIVLVRSKPEEAVLTACKLTFGSGAGPVTGNTGCHVATTCGNCNVPAAS